MDEQYTMYVCCMDLSLFPEYNSITAITGSFFIPIFLLGDLL